MLEILAIAGAILVLVGGTILTLIRGVLVDRTRARNKEFIMFNYGGLTGWPKEGDKPAEEPGTASQNADHQRKPKA